MQNNIIRKIEQAVNSQGFNEQIVMYTLVEIRKLAEQVDLGKYPRIFFMANWVVHYKMNYKPTKELLSELESSITADSHGDAIFGFVSFQELRVELINFLEKSSINTDNFKKYWQQFLEALVDIISDCPLENSNGAIIRSFIITNRDRGAYEYRAEIAEGSLKDISPKLSHIKFLEGTQL